MLWNNFRFEQSEQLLKHLQQEKKELNYLFIEKDCDSINNKSVSLFFKDNINNYSISRIDLIQDSRVVYSNVPIDDNNTFDNKISISIEKYIKNFNKVKLYTNKGSVILNVGQFYFDKVTVNNSESYRTLKMINSFTDTIENKFISYIKFRKENNYDPIGIQISAVIPSRFKAIGVKDFWEKISEDKETVLYKYVVIIPEKYFLKYSNITFEIMFSEIFKDVCYPKFIFYIPMDSSYFN